MSSASFVVGSASRYVYVDEPAVSNICLNTTGAGCSPSAAVAPTPPAFPQSATPADRLPRARCGVLWLQRRRPWRARRCRIKWRQLSPCLELCGCWLGSGDMDGGDRSNYVTELGCRRSERPSPAPQQGACTLANPSAPRRQRARRA